MLSQAKKHLSRNSWNRIKHSACGIVTTENVWMYHHHGLNSHHKSPDALPRYLADLVYPVVRYQ